MRHVVGPLVQIVRNNPWVYAGARTGAEEEAKATGNKAPHHARATTAPQPDVLDLACRWQQAADC